MSWDWLYYVALIAALFTGLFVNILGLPGLWLMVAAHAAYGWATGWNVHVGWSSLIIITSLALLAEGVEFIAGAAGSKAAGGSKRGMAGAIIGGIIGGLVGSPIFPIVGTIIGAVAGAGLGAFLVEMGVGRTHEQSMQIGIGAAKGRFWGILAKSLFGLAMLFVSLITALPTGTAPAALPPALPTTRPGMSPVVVPEPAAPPSPGAAPAPAPVER
jgi:hypothetical protein